jgi:disulfide bond formation protein DsbB
VDNNNRPPCAVCKLIRTYMFVAIPMILIMWTRPEFTKLKGISLTNGFASLIAVVFVTMVIWKYYQEFWKPRRENANKRRP